MHAFWEALRVAGTVGGLVALLLTIYLGLRAAGVLNRASYQILASYLPERDVLGWTAIPHFVVNYRNTGNVPVVFADFELLLPRHNVIQEGEFVGHLGADLFIRLRSMAEG